LSNFIKPFLGNICQGSKLDNLASKSNAENIGSKNLFKNVQKKLFFLKKSWYPAFHNISIQ